MVLDVKRSICVSDKGWITSASLKTFFLPVSPANLLNEEGGGEEDKDGRDAFTGHRLPVADLTWFAPTEGWAREAS